MQELSKHEIIDRVSEVLFEITRPRDAIELRKLCLYAGVTEEEAFMALNCLIDEGIAIRLTDGLPHKLYWKCYK
jgi:hypothetical protein